MAEEKSVADASGSAIRHPDGRIEHPGVGFEPSDVSFGWILAVMVGAIVTVAVIQICVLVFFQGYSEHLAEKSRSPYPLAPGPYLKLPPEPRLDQIDRLPPWDRGGKQQATSSERAAAKLRSLHSYGPAETDGFVHIPIERAMQLLAEKKMLKARPQPSADQLKRSGGLVDAGEPNSGRLFKGEPK